MITCIYWVGGRQAQVLSKKVCLNSQKVKNNTYWYFKTIEKSVDLAFYFKVVI